MNLPASGRAAGKVILLGEHAVVYGRPALAAGLELSLTATVTRSRGSLLLESDPPLPREDTRPRALVAAAAAALGVDADAVAVRIRSELPPGVGLGSSAALAVAVLRALAAAATRSLAADEELVLGRRLEGIFHGQSSGVDPAAAALRGGECLHFVRGEPPRLRRIHPARPLPLVIAFGETPRSTGAAVAGLRARWEADRVRHERLFDAVGAVVEEGIEAAARGDLGALGLAFDRNQELLETLGVSAPEVATLVGAARRAGAFGAKLTGGGAGGAVVALAADPERLAAALRETGVRTVVTSIGAVREVAA